MNIKSLDKQCQKILSFLLFHRTAIRFNGLYKTLNGYGLKVSKPTLSEHLKHLVKARLVKRKIEGIQNVSYRVDFEKYKQLNKTSEMAQDLLEYHEKNKKTYDSLAVADQIAYAHGFMIIQNLLLLKLEMKNILEPEHSYEYNLDYLFTIQIFSVFRNWLLDQCRKNPEQYKEVALNTLDDYMGKIIDAISGGNKETSAKQ